MTQNKDASEQSCNELRWLVELITLYTKAYKCLLGLGSHGASWPTMRVYDPIFRHSSLPIKHSITSASTNRPQ